MQSSTVSFPSRLWSIHAHWGQQERLFGRAPYSYLRRCPYTSLQCLPRSCYDHLCYSLCYILSSSGCYVLKIALIVVLDKACLLASIDWGFQTHHHHKFLLVLEARMILVSLRLCSEGARMIEIKTLKRFLFWGRSASLELPSSSCS